MNRFAYELKNFLGIAVAEPSLAAAEQGDATHFMDVQRRMSMYLRALWDRDFIMQQSDAAVAAEGCQRPFIENLHIHLPHAFHDLAPHGAGKCTGLDIYRAAATHAAAHIVYSTTRFSARSLDKFQIALISAIEDARVEAMAIREFPGLQRLWAAQHRVSQLDENPAWDYLDRLARALLDDGYRDEDPWITEGRALFRETGAIDDPELSRSVGLRLAASFRGVRPRADVHARRHAAYRDDNRALWLGQGRPSEIVNPYFRSKTRLRVDDRAKEPKVPRRSSREPGSDGAALDTYYYPEWNYRSQSSDPSWVTLRENIPATGDANIVVRIVEDNRHLVSRMKNLLQAIREGAVRRVRKLEIGDEVDVNAAVRAQIHIRVGMQPDTRVMMRTERKVRDVSALFLLDLSRSMNTRIPGRGHTALELTQQVTALVAEAIDAVGDSFAVHGFCSVSRHNVGYFRLKDFAGPYDEKAKARIAGMSGQMGTRMGAAIRHATHYLERQKSGKRLLILMSDGEPSDIDVPDANYLRDDAKISVDEARRAGIRTYCISFDPGADRYVARIFGAKNYTVVDQIKHLPEKMLRIYAALTR